MLQLRQSPVKAMAHEFYIEPFHAKGSLHGEMVLKVNRECVISFENGSVSHQKGFFCCYKLDILTIHSLKRWFFKGSLVQALVFRTMSSI